MLDDAHAARRRYKKDLDLIKPDLEAYNKQKAIAMGYASGALVGFNPSAATSASALQVRTISSHSFLSQVLTFTLDGCVTSRTEISSGELVQRREHSDIW